MACLEMGGTGNLPVPSGDSPDGMGEALTLVDFVPLEFTLLLAVPSGKLPLGTGRLPVPPSKYCGHGVGDERLGLKVFQHNHGKRTLQSILEIGNDFRVHFSQSVPLGPCE